MDYKPDSANHWKLTYRFPEAKGSTWIFLILNIMSLITTFVFLWRTALTEPGIIPSFHGIKRVPHELHNVKKSDAKLDVFVQYKDMHELERTLNKKMSEDDYLEKYFDVDKYKFCPENEKI